MSNLPKAPEPLTLPEAARLFAKAAKELGRLGVTGYHLGIGFTKGKGYHVIAISNESLEFSETPGPFYLTSSTAHFVTAEATVGTEVISAKFALMAEQNHWVW